MKRLTMVFVVSLLVTACSVTAYGAAGSVFGTLRTARVLGQGKTDLGLGVGLADATSFLGQLTYGLSRYTDGRLKVALADDDFDDDIHLAFGGDFAWQFWTYERNGRHPFDMALGAFFEFRDAGPISVFQIGSQLLASYPIALNNGGSISPYGRFNARLESYSGDGPGGSDSELEIGLNGGVAWAPTTTIVLYGEFQLDGNDGFFFGIDFNVQ